MSGCRLTSQPAHQDREGGRETRALNFTWMEPSPRNPADNGELRNKRTLIMLCAASTDFTTEASVACARTEKKHREGDGQGFAAVREADEAGKGAVLREEDKRFPRGKEGGGSKKETHPQGGGAAGSRAPNRQAPRASAEWDIDP